MKAEGLLRRNPGPTREEILRALAGNLCRCTGYVKIVDAIEAGRRGRGGARRELPGRPAPARPAGVGRPRRPLRRAGAGPRREALRRRHDRARDAARRAALRRPPAGDRPPDRRLARRRRPRGRRGRHLADVPGERVQGLITRDWPLLVAEGETTRCVGDVLAAVAAGTRRRPGRPPRSSTSSTRSSTPSPTRSPPSSRRRAARPPRRQPALDLGRPPRRRGGGARLRGPRRHRALHHAVRSSTPSSSRRRAWRCRTTGSPGEPPSLHVHSQGQGAWEDRRQIASFLGLPESSVRVTQVATGGAFGGKEDLGVQGQTALLALVTGRPVLLTLSRRGEHPPPPQAPPLHHDYKAGCDAEGRLVAVRARIVGDTGAYASVGAKVLERAAGHACGAYRVPNVDVEARAVYTNNPPAGAMRGFGVVQVTFAMDGVLDRLAERVGLDGWEIRWRNALEAGDRFGTGQLLGPGVGVKKTLLAVRDAYRSARYAGIACAAKNIGIGNGMVERGRAVLRVEQDGTLTLFHSWTEMGQGVHTVMPRSPARSSAWTSPSGPGRVDTARELDTGETTASRATTLGGQAVIDAARKLRAALDAAAARRRPRDASRGGVPRRVRRRLDDRDSRGHPRPGDPLRLRLGDPGRDPRRRGPPRAGRRRPGRRAGPQPDAPRGAGRGRASTWASGSPSARSSCWRAACRSPTP